MRTFIIVATLLALNCSAQQITWQKYYQTSIDPNRILRIIEQEDSGFVATTPIYHPIPSTHIIRLNKYGDTLWVKKCNWGYGLVKNYNGCYLAIAGSKIIKLDANFDSVSSVDYSQYASGFNKITIHIDSGFILNSNNTIIKTDSLGAVQWTGFFSGSINKVIPCVNGDILVVGMYSGFGDTYKAKLFNATGQVLWERWHGVVEEDWGVIQEFGMKDAVELPDGNFLTACGGYHPHLSDSSGWDMIKLDRLTGDTLQTYVYDTLTAAIEYLVYMTYTKDSNIVASMDESLLKIKQDGSLIWFRYAPMTEVWDIIGCSDNGIAIAGSLYYYPNPIMKSAYAKLDSLGNIYNFQGITSITVNELRVYPNPAFNELAISSEQLAYGQKVTVTIYDMLGKVQLQQTVIPQGDFNVDVNGMPSGIYMLQLKQEDRLFNGRFLKE